MTEVRTTAHHGLGAVADELAARRVDEALVTLLTDFAEGHTVEMCATGSSSLPLSAARDAYAAVYVARRSISVALDPVVASQLSKAHGLRLESRTNVTSYVHFRSDDLADADGRKLAYDTLGRAFARADKGDRWRRGLSDRAQSEGTVCPKCNLQRSIDGTCDNCD
jgi:hypothetical protein